MVFPRISNENCTLSRYYECVITHSSPDQLRALAGGNLPYIAVREVVLHVRACPECQSAFAEVKECLLIEEELNLTAV